MNKYTDKELDKVLSMLNTNGILTPIEYQSEEEKQRLDGIFRHLEASGLVKLHEAGYISAVLLLPKGLKFINDGGFHAKGITNDKDEHIKNLQAENLELSNINLRLSSEKIKYEKKFRRWRATSIILSISFGLFEFIQVIFNLIV